MKLRVLVVSEDPLARTGLGLLLEDGEDLTVIGQVGIDDDWPEGGEPDVVIWDLGFGVRSGLDRLRSLGAEGPPVVAVVADESEAREALAVGARAVLPRNSDGDHLAAALQAAAHGLVILDESFLTLLREPAPATPQELPEALTPRELEVLQLLSQGLPNKLIAQRLRISEHTAKFHVNAILGKLGVQSRSEAIVQAVRLGLVAL